MKILVLLLAVIGLSGCIAVPVYDTPGAYVGVPAPTVVVRPYVGGYYYGYRGAYRGGYRDGYRHRSY